MTRRSRIGRRGRWALGAVVLASCAIAVWWEVGGLRSSSVVRSQDRSAPGDRPPAPAGPGAIARRPAPGPGLALDPRPPPGEVAIAGRVIDVLQQRPVGAVEVVFRTAGGESTTTTGRDGGYSIRIAPGVYRAYVRDDTVMSIGRRDPDRLPGERSAELAGVPDEALMAIVVARRDADGVDLSVVRGGVVAGRVVDAGGHPIRGASLRAIGGALRPALATDLAESGADGSFELRLPPGAFELAASHPRFAGIAADNVTRYVVRPGDRVETTVVLTAGCVISGRVIAVGGAPAGDGAIEQQTGVGDLAFLPAGQIEPDGTFRWATTAPGDVALRAWPWKSPPSQARRFACRDGARFDSVVFELPDQPPDLEGTLVDRAGRPVGFAYLDLRPLEPDGVAQQERTDASGRWQVYRMPPGRYQVVAQADGRGVARSVVTSPSRGIELELSGTGRLEGTTPHLTSGSFELVVESCFHGSERIPLLQARWLVTVTGGRFAVDDLPACPLAFTAIWRGRPVAGRAAILAGDTARVELDVGVPRDKTVRGRVRDAAGAPVAGAVVSVERPGDEAADATTVTDGAGSYSIRAFSGASLRAAAHGKLGRAQVGGADIASEQVDLVIGDADDAGGSGG